MDIRSTSIFAIICISGVSACHDTKELDLRISSRQAPQLATNAKAASANPSSPSYTFRLESFEIAKIRSAHLDTDIVGLSVRAGNDTYGPITEQYGDVGEPGNGAQPELHQLGNDIALGPIGPIKDDTPVVLSYTIMNSGHSNYDSANKLVTSTLTTLTTAGTATNPWIGVLGLFAQYGVGIGFANCDGLVAAASISSFTKDNAPITGNLTQSETVEQFTGKTLKQLTNGSTIYVHKDETVGTDSPSGCGSNSDYFVTWSVTRDN